MSWRLRSRTGLTGRPLLVRRFTLGSGPLKRTSDRLQVLSRLCLLVALLAAIPLAYAVGAVTRSSLGRSAVQQATQRHEVTATLMADAPLPIGPSTMAVPTDAVWAGPGGTVHDVRVPVSPGARAGEVISIWLDRNGRLTDAPLQQTDVDMQAVIRAAWTFLGLVVAAAGLHRGVVAVLDRRRARRWTAEWAEVEPQWAGRVR